MLQTLKNAWKIAELRSKLLFTLVIVVLYRIGSVIYVPFVNSAALNSVFDQEASLFAYFNILSGDAFSKATLFALSISPYITASIVIQLLTIAIPALERLSKQGPDGRKKLTQITRYCTVILALITSVGYYFFLKSYQMITDTSVFAAIVIISCYCAGAAVIMWLAEKINDHGIGNGISIILFANIVASLPGTIYRAFVNVENSKLGIFVPIITVVLLLAMIVFVVHVTNAERRLPVQYAKRQVGRRMYGGQNTYIPMKLNMSGVMPIIFASSIAAIPTTIALIFPPKGTGIWSKIVNFFSSTSPVYMVIYFLLIIGFSYFYLAISFNPVEVANNVKNNGGSIPGIRPGKPTVDYISRILSRITLIGSIFLGIVATLPLIVGWIDNSLSGLAFGGSSLLILVSVALETTKEIEAQMTMRHYKGFLE
ncbi:MAG: preprotein translocase subunit SecY [Clostridia bacterium]|nr:preprotein translocase subunit SecY [Clostridia bacterium]